MGTTNSAEQWPGSEQNTPCYYENDYYSPSLPLSLLLFLCLFLALSLFHRHKHTHTHSLTHAELGAGADCGVSGAVVTVGAVHALTYCCCCCCCCC
eukprot:3683406-Rhodomonas_salina.2